MSEEGFPANQFHMILKGHVLEQLAKLPPDCIDTIITSPPYWGLRDYKLPPTIWDGDPKCEHEWNEVSGIRSSWGNKEVLDYQVQGTNRGAEANVDALTKKSDFCSKCSAWKGQLGLEPDFRLYVKHILQVTEELKRVMKPTGCLWLNLGDTYSGSGQGGQTGHGDYKRQKVADALESSITIKTGLPAKSLCFIPQRVALAMIDEQGWILRNQIVWYKPNGMPSSVRDRFSNRWEPMFFFVKKSRYFFDLDAVREPHTHPDARYNTGSWTKSIRDAGLVLDEAKKANKSVAYSRPSDYVGNLAGKNPGDVIKDKQSEVIDPLTGESKATYAGFNLRWKENGPNKMGKNPGDVIREPAVRSKSWASNPGHEFTHERVYAEGKNGTDFWEINTEPHPFAHFAVYPDRLVERPIKASCPAEVCVKCGKARERISETESHYNSREKAHAPRSSPSKVNSTGWNPPSNKTLGWTSCSCNEPFCPGIVLDPFAGSGTTAVVAKRLQRSSISIELADHYVPIIKQRLDWGHRTIDEGITWLEP